MTPLAGFSLILPARNEEGNIGGVVDRALEVLPRIARDFEVLVVDDGSIDGTAAEIEARSRRDPRVRCLRRATAGGYGAALRAGFAEARHPLLGYCDGDGQFDLEDLPALVEPVQRGEADASTGYRGSRNDPLHRRLLGRAWSGVVRALFGVEARDVDCGFKVLPADLARRLDLRARGGFASGEILGKMASAGLRVAERPVRHGPRLRGAASGARAGVALGAVRDLGRLGLSVALFGPPAPWAGPLARFVPAPRPLAWMLTLVLAAFYGARTARVVAEDRPVDFYLYLMAAKGVAAGEDVYGAGGEDWKRLAEETGVPVYAPPYRYPPLTAILARGLLPLPARRAAAVWIGLSACALLASAWLLGGVLRVRYGTPLALAALGGFFPAVAMLSAGQVSGFVLLALCAGLRGLLRGPPAIAGTALAIGAHLKLVPLAQLAWLGGTRRWRPFAAGLAALAVLGAVSAVLAEPGAWGSYARNLHRLGEAWTLMPTAGNQALNGFVCRLLLPGDPGGGAARAAWAAGSILLVAATAFLCIRAGGTPRTAALEFSLVTVASCLITPYTWYHQFVLLLLPGVVFADHALSVPGHRILLAVLVSAYAATSRFVFGLWSRGESPLGDSIPFLSAILLWLLLARALRAEARAAP